MLFGNVYEMKTKLISNLYNRLLKNKNIKNGILYTFFSFINNGISFLLVLVLAGYLAPKEYGFLNLFSTFVTLFIFIVTLESTSYITLSFFKKTKEQLRQIILAVFVITGVMLVICLTIFFTIPDLIEKIIGIDINNLCIGIIICVFSVFNNVNLDIWRLEEKPVAYGTYSISYALLNCIATLLFVIYFKNGWEGRVYAWFIVGLIYFFISIAFMIKRGYLVISSLSLSLFAEILTYSLPLIPHSISYWLKMGSDRFIINYFWDSGEVGLYSFAMNFASIINIIGTAFNTSNSVFLYKKLSEGYLKNKDNLFKQARIMTFIYIGITVVIISSTFVLVPIILPKYTTCLRFIIPLCIGAFFQCVYLLWVNYLFYYKKTSRLMNITLLTCVIQILLSIILTRHSTLYTAYISMFISMSTMFLVMFYSKFILRNESSKA